MHVYRIQHHSTLNGPFGGSPYAGHHMNDHRMIHDPGQFHTVEEYDKADSLVYAGGYFGAMNMLVLDSFVRSWRGLYDQGFELVIYDVPEDAFIIADDGQVVFVRAKSTLYKRCGSFREMCEELEYWIENS